MTLTIRRVAYAALAAGALAASLLVAGATHSPAHHTGVAGGRVHFANTFAAAPTSITRVQR